MLRLLSRPGLVSADSFEAGFAGSLAPDIEVTSLPAAGWLRGVFGDWTPGIGDSAAAGRLAAALTGFDLLCPSFEVLPILPVLLQLRQRSRADWRLLLIAHSPALYGLEWLTIGELLQTGDVVVAPTRSAASIIDFLCPVISPFVQVIAHPVPQLPAHDRTGRRPTRLVSLTRIQPSKLLHRQLDALAVLHESGHRELSLTIAGPLLDSTGRLLPYARTLMNRAHRLGLDSCVRFPGIISGSQDKADLLAEADLLLNLSLTVEESFGKSIVEAQWTGLASVVTDWDGLPETMGGVGAAVPLTDRGSQLDLDPEVLAGAIRALIEAPVDPVQAQQAAQRSAPERVRAAYVQALMRDRADPPASPGSIGRPVLRGSAGEPARYSLLSRTAPLTALSAAGLDRMVGDDWSRRLAELAGTQPVGSSERERLAGTVYHGIRRPLELFMSNLSREPIELGHALPPAQADTLAAALAISVTGRATASSLTACLGQLADGNRRVELAAAAPLLPALVESTPAASIIDIEATRLTDSAGAALRRSLALGDLDTPYAAHRLLQLTTLARLTGRPEVAAEPLDRWLARFPDEPTSPAVLAARKSLEPPSGRAAHVTANSSETQPAGTSSEGVANPWSAELSPSVRELIVERAGPIQAVRPLGPRRRTMLVETEGRRVVVQRLSDRHTATEHERFFAALARHDAGLSPALLGAVPEPDGCMALFAYVDAHGDVARPDLTAAGMLAVLARLRSAPVPAGRRLERQWLELLSAHFGAVAKDRPAARLLSRLAEQVPDAEPVLAHGDLSRANIIGASTLIDWEEYGAASPGFDAGWLLALVSVGADGFDLRPDEWSTAFAERGIPAESLTWFQGLGLLRLLARSGQLGLPQDRQRLVAGRIEQSIEDVLAG